MCNNVQHHDQGEDVALKADHSGMNVGGLTVAEPPTTSVYGHRLAEAWAEKIDRDAPPIVGGARLRASWAGMCARAIGYNLLGTEASNPLTVADHWRMGLGSIVHRLLQDVVTDAFPGATAEYETTADGLVGCHLDLLDEQHMRAGDNVPDPYKVAVEIKTINGFGMKRAIGARGPADGPRQSAKLQGALGAYASGADELRIVYLSLELLSPAELTKLGSDNQVDRFVAEWAYPREMFAPWAEAELARMRKIAAVVDLGSLPPRAIPELPQGARITNPATGAWTLTNDEGEITEAGNDWRCKGYCQFQAQCIQDGPT